MSPEECRANAERCDQMAESLGSDNAGLRDTMRETSGGMAFKYSPVPRAFVCRKRPAGAVEANNNVACLGAVPACPTAFSAPREHCRRLGRASKRCESA